VLDDLDDFIRNNMLGTRCRMGFHSTKENNFDGCKINIEKSKGANYNSINNIANKLGEIQSDLDQ
jgi:hypothetical protein